jgi:hypothetical protein
VTEIVPTRAVRRSFYRLFALLALVAVVCLNAPPHRHADGRSEQGCAICQVAYSGGFEEPQPSSGALDPLQFASAPLPDACESLGALARLAGPPPGRSPPASSLLA